MAQTVNDLDKNEKIDDDANYIKQTINWYVLDRIVVGTIDRAAASEGHSEDEEVVDEVSKRFHLHIFKLFVFSCLAVILLIIRKSYMTDAVDYYQ